MEGIEIDMGEGLAQDSSSRPARLHQHGTSN